SPTQRALSRSGVSDFRTMLPSARRSATIAGVANNASEWSRLTGAADVIGFLRCPLFGVGGLLYATTARPGNVPSRFGMWLPAPVKDCLKLNQMLRIQFARGACGISR